MNTKLGKALQAKTANAASRLSEQKFQISPGKSDPTGSLGHVTGGSNSVKSRITDGGEDHRQDLGEANGGFYVSVVGRHLQAIGFGETEDCGVSALSRGKHTLVDVSGYLATKAQGGQHFFVQVV